MVEGFCYNLYSIIITFAGAFGCEWQNMWVGEGNIYRARVWTLFIVLDLRFSWAFSLTYVGTCWPRTLVQIKKCDQGISEKHACCHRLAIWNMMGYSFAWQRGYYESVNGYKVWPLGYIKMDMGEEVTIGHFTVRG